MTHENPYTYAIQGTGLSTLEIDVQGNLTSIVNNDVTPSALDSTIFTAVNVASSTTVTYRIHNGGSPDLNIFGTSISGTHSSDFVITTAPASTVSFGNIRYALK
jgi:hypothetical protein